MRWHGRWRGARCSPGSTARRALPVSAADHATVIRFCKERAIGLVVVGPEAPLVAGLVDDLAAAGVKAFGPTRAAAQLEGSKGFTKDLCRALLH
jgi:phosphoribosylamine--glycine ligase